MSETREPWVSSTSRDWHLVRQVLIVIGVVGLAYLVLRLAGVLLLLFAAVLLSVVFGALADLLAKYTPISRRFSLLLAILLLGAAFTGVIYVFGSQIGAQFSALAVSLPEAADNLGERFGIQDAREKAETFLQGFMTADLLPTAAGAGMAAISTIGNLVLVIFAAVYLASEPKVYRTGIVKLMHPDHQEQAADTLMIIGNALRLWFAGQLVVMTAIGLLSYVGYQWLGLPAPLALALIAALTNFIPFIGPIIGALPALVFAFNMDMSTVLWTLGLVTAVQQFESGAITPLVQKKTVLLPPALALFTIVAFGVLFGLLGVMLAVPLTVAIYVAVKKLYVREALGESTIVPGEQEHKETPSQ